MHNNNTICLNRFNSKLNSINDIDPDIQTELAKNASKLIADIQKLEESQPTHSLVELFAELPHIITQEFYQYNINHNNKTFIPTPPPLPLSTHKIQQLNAKGKLLGGVKKAGKGGKGKSKSKSSAGKSKAKGKGQTRSRSKMKSHSAVKTLGKSKNKKKKAAQQQSQNEESENEESDDEQSENVQQSIQDDTYDASSENEHHSDEEKQVETGKKCMCVWSIYIIYV